MTHDVPSSVAELTPIDAAPWAAFEAALAAEGLPTSDLRDSGQRFFALGDGAAFGGYARTGEIALLRSFVTAPERRGLGLGADILTAVLAEARRDGAREAWLLTTTAEAFFGRHGFVTVDRAEAPAAVKVSAQFARLCPAAARVMCRKPL